MLCSLLVESCTPQEESEPRTIDSTGVGLERFVASATRQQDAEMQSGTVLRLWVVVVALAVTHSVEHVDAKRAFAGSILQSRCAPERCALRMPGRPSQALFPKITCNECTLPVTPAAAD